MKIIIYKKQEGTGFYWTKYRAADYFSILVFI